MRPGSMQPMGLSDWPRDGRATLLAATLGIGCAVGAAVVAARALGWLEAAELNAYDRFVAWRAESRPVSERVVLIVIREEELARYGHPIPDEVLAEALERVLSTRPRVVGLDIYRTPPRGDAGMTGWRRLAEIFGDDAPIVGIEKLPEGPVPGVSAPGFMDPTRQVGFSDVVLDDDGIVRRGLLMLWNESGEPQISFSLRLALRFLEADGLGLGPDPDDPDSMMLGGVALPPLDGRFGPYARADAGGYQLLLDFPTPVDGFARYPLEQLLDGRVDASALADRAVLIGTTSPSVKDDFLTSHGNGERISGVTLHAGAMAQLLQAALDGSTPMRSWGGGAEAGWILGWALAGALLVFLIPQPWILAATLALGVGALVGAAFWLFASGWWVPWVSQAIACLGSAGASLVEYNRRERAERRAVMDLFGRYVSRNVAEELWNQRDAFMSGGRPKPQRLIITAMLTDLKGYTKAAEEMDPAALMDWVNGYMDRMTQVVESHGGIVDDYTGDGIKANFGVPVAAADDDAVGRLARQAVRCALAMGEALEELAVEWRVAGLPVVPMRIGLHTGEAVGGSLGSASRMKYTTVGDTVNTAARLESFHKDEFEVSGSGGEAPLFRILLSDTTRRHLDGRFEVSDLGIHEIRGGPSRYTSTAPGGSLRTRRGRHDSRMALAGCSALQRRALRNGGFRLRRCRGSAASVERRGEVLRQGLREAPQALRSAFAGSAAQAYRGRHPGFRLRSRTRCPCPRPRCPHPRSFAPRLVVLVGRFYIARRAHADSRRGRRAGARGRGCVGPGSGGERGCAFPVGDPAGAGCCLRVVGVGRGRPRTQGPRRGSKRRDHAGERQSRAA